MFLNVDLYVVLGEILVVLGDNGVGKSMLIKIISGVYRFDRGMIWVGGVEKVFYLLVDVCDVGVVIVF